MCACGLTHIGMSPVPLLLLIFCTAATLLPTHGYNLSLSTTPRPACSTPSCASVSSEQSLLAALRNPIITDLQVSAYTVCSGLLGGRQSSWGHRGVRVGPLRLQPAAKCGPA